MLRYSVDEAIQRLSDLIDRANKGETIVITRQGVAVALLAAAPVPPNGDAADAMEGWIRYRDQRNLTLGDVSIRDLIEEGRP